MSNRRPVEELSLAELERIVLMRRREERLRRLHARGLDRDLPELPEPPPSVAEREREDLPEPSRHPLDILSQPRRRRNGPPSQTPTERSWRERLLLLTEIIGLAGLAIAVILFVADLRQLNADAAATQAAALTTPAPVSARPAILPGGSQPPPGAGAAVPAIYQQWIESSNPTTILQGDTTSERQATRVRITKIGVDAPVVLGDDWESLKKGAGHHPGSANPGERGNMVISAHNDIFGEIFRDLNQLEPGDEVEIFDGAGRRYTYRVQTKRIVEPTDISVLDPSTEPIVTLITCHPYLIDTQRLIIIAELQS